MIPAISNIAWAPEERLTAYNSMVAANITGLEIAPRLFFHNAQDPFDPEPAEARRAMSETEEAGLVLVSMQSLLFGVNGAELFGDTGARAHFEEGMRRAIKLAGRFLIPNIVFGSPRQRRIPDNLSAEDARKRAIEVFQRLGEIAAELGTVIAVEANPIEYGTNFLNNLQEANDFVRRVSHPGVRLMLDLGAMHMNNDMEETLNCFPELVAHINHVHVSEKHLSPAPADALKIKPVLEGLRDAGYKKAVSIEMKRGARGLEEVTDRLSVFNLALSSETYP